MNLANKISVFRILLIPFFIACVLYYSPQKDYLRFWALGIFTLAVVSDAIDGFIARNHKQKTELGTILDPIADKLLLICAFISLSFIKNLPDGLRIPAWVVLIVISRDIIIILGATVLHLVTGKLKVNPSWLGKATTFFQMVTIITVLSSFKTAEVFWNLAAIFTVLSGIDYIWRGSKLFNEA